LFGLYSNDEAELKAFHDDILPAYQNTLYAITGPKDAAHQQLLEAGHITGKNKKGYKYKVTMRDGRYDAHAKQQLVNYFDSLGDVVSVSKATRRSLENGHMYTFGIYIHTSDPTILSFVELILPGIVNKTYEITKI
jgi:adenine-specific DNA methylase